MRDCIENHFYASSRDLTPAPARHAVRVVYAPASQEPEVTRHCAGTLSNTELGRAERLATIGARALFAQRRAFRRFCGYLALESSQPLSQVAFNEAANGRPYLTDLPDCWFSFSSCRFGFAGAWSSTHGVGIDLEDQSKDPGATEIARHFFSATETEAVAAPNGVANLATFFRLWCLKEAALKSIGEGLPFGLDAFEFELDPAPRVVRAPLDHGGPERFDAHVMDGTDSCAALVIRARAPHP